jgi:hypothetical protein
MLHRVMQKLRIKDDTIARVIELIALLFEYSGVWLVEPPEGWAREPMEPLVIHYCLDHAFELYRYAAFSKVLRAD